jgi:hypothetical protein
MPSTVTAFLDEQIICSGQREEVMRDLEQRYPSDLGAIIVIDDDTGRVTDLNYWDALASHQPPPRGRPKLGVQAKEVTLMPRHWQWLSAQPRGASATLRRLVDEAQRQDSSARTTRLAAGYEFLQALCGNKRGYEEALRALYRNDEQRLRDCIADWPEDIKSYFGKLVGIDSSCLDQGGPRG